LRLRCAAPRPARRPQGCAVAARHRASEEALAPQPLRGGRPSDSRRAIEWLLRGSLPRELFEGFPTGWRQLDYLHMAVPGEVTLIRPADDGDREARSPAAAMQVRLNRQAAHRLAFEQARRLACGVPAWSFRAVFDSGTREEHYADLQDDDGRRTDVPWIFEHFSVEVMPPSARLSRCLSFEKVSPLPRGVIVLRHGMSGAQQDDANSVLRIARDVGVHVCIVEDSAGGDDAEEDHLFRVCDNCLTVSALHNGPPAVGVEPKVHSLEVRVDKARLRRAPGGGRHHGVLRLADAPRL